LEYLNENPGPYKNEGLDLIINFDFELIECKLN
jgi:hypothetical protein